MLLEMKDVSELAVDLAYSSLLYDSEQIAEEVEELEEILDTMQKRLQRKALEALKRDQVSVDQALALIRLAGCAEVISDAALGIADVVLRDVELHPVLAAMIRDSDVIITRGRVRDESFIVGKTLEDVTLETETGMRAIAIKRGPTWIYGPGGDTQILAGDIIVARGPGEGVEPFEDALTGRIKGWD
ncbi:MAG: PhoU family transcriptional regulator [Euryarchaeota archaeon]|nr:PhoU family transcriptional regulator [Euryarchaeota archaeon]